MLGNWKGMTDMERFRVGLYGWLILFAALIIFGLFAD